MKLIVDSNGMIELESSVGGLSDLRPLLNGRVVTGARLRPAPDGQRWFSNLPGGGRFGLEAHEESGAIRLRCRIDGVPPETLDSFGLRFDTVSNALRFLRNGYFSWDGSRYVDIDQLDPATFPETGYAMVQFLPRSGGGSVVAGFERHDRFQQSLIVDNPSGVPSLEMVTHWDRRLPTPGEGAVSEWMIVFDHPGVEEALRVWAQRVAAASLMPPRLSAPRITGWCSWYSLYAAINEESIRHHLRSTAEVAQRESLPLRVFQIDDGFTPEMGDWLETKPQFPHGMKPLLDEIRAAGFVPGLWIAPFMVGNRSRLYAAHPDWVVRDRKTGGPLAHMRFYGEFRWHKRSEEYYILDATHPDAFDYLRMVFRTWRREWGCEYFKTDFMHFGSEYGPDRALWHTPGRSRMEIWRSVAELIREEIGDALWLGCGCPLWASVGLVDAVRIGRDVGAEWSGGAQSVLRDGATRNFANGILWQADPDCLLLRSRFHNLGASEQRALILYGGLTGGLLLTSDDLSELPQEHIELFRLLLNAPTTVCRYPRLGSDDAVLVQVREMEGEVALFLFNTGESEETSRYALADLGLEGCWSVSEWHEQTPGTRTAVAADAKEIVVTLARRSGRLFFLSRAV